MFAASRLICLPLAAACLCLASLAAAQPPAAAEAERLTKLIADLGSDEFTIREAATDELTRMGLPAFAALEAAATHPDREVRYRSQRILGLIREHDLKRRLEAFLNGKEVEGDYPLPGWSRFKKTYGDGVQSRTLFVAMQRADPELMRAIEEGPRLAADVVGQRAAQLQDLLRLGVQQQLTVGQVSAALFVAAEEDVALPASSLSLLLNQCYQQSFREALADSVKGKLPRQMLGSIIRRADDTAASYAMQVAIEFNAAEGLYPAMRVVRKQARGSMQYALLLVARHGTVEQLPTIEALLSEKTLLSRTQQNGETYELQLRDLALGTAVILSHQDLHAYFQIENRNVEDLKLLFFNTRTFAFKSEGDRNIAMERWSQRSPSQDAIRR